MHFFDRSRGIARRPQPLGHVVRIHRAQLGSFIGVAPGHLRPGAVVLEIFQAQAEADAAVGADDAAEFIEIGRLAICGQAHHFVFVAEFAESQILRHRRVVHPQRMREGDRAVNLHAIAVAGAPHGAGEIAQPVGGKQRGLLKGRNKKRAGQVRLVMLDAMKLAREFFPARRRMPAPALRECPRIASAPWRARARNSASAWRKEASFPGAPRDCAEWRRDPLRRG